MCKNATSEPHSLSLHSARGPDLRPLRGGRVIPSWANTRVIKRWLELIEKQEWCHDET
jgi:hypothetical protein